MKNCVNCKSSIADDTAFCPFCSAKQPSVKKQKPKNEQKPKLENKQTIIKPEEFDKTVPVSADKGTNVFKEKPAEKIEKINNEKNKLQEEVEKIKEEKEKLAAENEQNKELALKDKLTGLKNRTAFEQDIKEIKLKDLCCISVDANNLKKINDSIGHKYGDYLIKEVAETLSQVFGENVYRIGGDEFEILLNGEGTKVVDNKVNAVHQLLKEKESNYKEDFEITAAIGVAYSDGTNSAKEIMEEADRNMYKDKKKYKDSIKTSNAYEPNFDGYYDDVKAEYEEAVKDNKNDTIKTIIKIGSIAVIAIVIWMLVFF